MKSPKYTGMAVQGVSSPGDDSGHFCGHFFTGVLFSMLLVLGSPAFAQPDTFKTQRFDMVEEQIVRRGVREPDLLNAMSRVPRHLFVPESAQSEAYEDRAIAIDQEQTLPQAYLSARMIELLELSGKEKVLEIGTGSGYDAAILSRVAGEVLSIEINDTIARRARRLLENLGYENVRVRTGNGYQGWPEEAPFDAILVTAAPRNIPEVLFDQLKVGGRMVIAVGAEIQDLQVIHKTAEGRTIRRVTPVVLGPMVRENER